jgi:uncharacterized protein YjaZ
MNVVDTNRWLEHYVKKMGEKSLFTSTESIVCETICEHLVPYFNHVRAVDIYSYLIQHGMFHGQSQTEMELTIKSFKEKQIWFYVKSLLIKLRKKWNGPAVNVFILPLDEGNEMLMNDLKGKSGIGFKDKIFLFINKNTRKQSVKALVTHEYHHVCRLAATGVSIENLTLLDSLFIEGLAEHAVNEYVGKDHVAIWAKLYKNEELEDFWHHYINPNIHLRGKSNHHPYLYGSTYKFPKWLGYSIGYYLVSLAKKNNAKLNTKTMLSISSEKLLASALKEKGDKLS